tara:strand:- start:128 stop:418 length:291 start_codon:yes stop_codon:yes gene_type:complete
MDIDKVVEIIREAKKKSKCPAGFKWSKKKGECVPKKYPVGRVYAGWGRGRDEKEDDDSKKNGSNGNGHSNGSSGNGDGGNGNGGNGNGGGDGGGGE